MVSYHPYSIFPLGDTALTIDFGNTIDLSLNLKVQSLYHLLLDKKWSEVLDIVPAYSSVSIYYDLCAIPAKGSDKTAFEWMAEKIECLTGEKIEVYPQLNRKLKVPVCYSLKFGTELQELAQHKGLSTEEVIRIHTSRSYRVYMLGFLPGFAYMGDVEESISMARRPVPKKVAAGSVGIAGKQTGIYPLACPGGWQIIGRTPLNLFDQQQPFPVLFQQGDEVTFYSISEDEFEIYQKRNS